MDAMMSALALAARGLGAACLAAATFGAVYACVAAWAVGAFAKRAPEGLQTTPSIALMKPLHGDEPGLYDNLKSYCVQDYPGSVQLIFGVQDPDDPAIGVVEALRREHPGARMVLTIGASGQGGNRKIANLMNMAPHAASDVVVISDSDVRVAPDHLSRLVGALEQPGVGLVNCLYRGRPTGSIWSTLAAMDIDYRFAPSVVVGFVFGLAHPCLGPTMALRRSLLEAVGGFQYLSNFLADDYELGRAVRQRGLKIAFAGDLIDHLCPEKTLRAMLMHEFRWARTVRLIEPAGYTGSGVTHFLTLAMIGALLLGLPAWSLGLLGLMAAIRFGLVWSLSRRAVSRSGLWLFPIRDILSFGVFIAAFFSNRVEWRGARLKLRSNGEVTAY